MPPPLSMDVEDDDLQETNGAEIHPVDFGTIDFRPAETESLSQLSQGTNPIASATDETWGDTQTLPTVRETGSNATPQTSSLSSSATAVAIALAISIPVSLLLGTVLGFLLRSVM